MTSDLRKRLVEKRIVQKRIVGKRTVDIAVAVRKFQPIGQDDACSTATFTLSKCEDDGVEILRERRDTVIVVKAEVDLAFHLEGGYLPIGIGFRQEGHAAPTRMRVRAAPPRLSDPVGIIAFPRRYLDVQGTTTVLAVHDAVPEPATFDFDLVIQRLVDGSISRIDPKIRNIGTLPA